MRFQISTPLGASGVDNAPPGVIKTGMRNPTTDLAPSFALLRAKAPLHLDDFVPAIEAAELTHGAALQYRAAWQRWLAANGHDADRTAPVWPVKLHRTPLYKLEGYFAKAINTVRAAARLIGALDALPGARNMLYYHRIRAERYSVGQFVLRARLMHCFMRSGAPPVTAARIAAVIKRDQIDRFRPDLGVFHVEHEDYGVPFRPWCSDKAVSALLYAGGDEIWKPRYNQAAARPCTGAKLLQQLVEHGVPEDWLASPADSEYDAYLGALVQETARQPFVDLRPKTVDEVSDD